MKMEESRKCIYCKEIMTYGPRRQIMFHGITKDGKRISKSVPFLLYGWACSMKDENCDIVLDKKDDDKNEINMKEADKELKKLFTLSPGTSFL